MNFLLLLLIEGFLEYLLQDLKFANFRILIVSKNLTIRTYLLRPIFVALILPISVTVLVF